MRPSRLAVHQHAYEMLLEYVTRIFPVKTGRNCTKEETHATVMRNPHESALEDKAVAHSDTEAKGKVASNRTRLVLYDEIKSDLPKQMKL